MEKMSMWSCWVCHECEAVALACTFHLMGPQVIPQGILTLPEPQYCQHTPRIDFLCCPEFGADFHPAIPAISTLRGKAMDSWRIEAVRRTAIGFA